MKSLAAIPLDRLPPTTTPQRPPPPSSRSTAHGAAHTGIPISTSTIDQRNLQPPHSSRDPSVASRHFLRGFEPYSTRRQPATTCRSIFVDSFTPQVRHPPCPLFPSFLCSVAASPTRCTSGDAAVVVVVHDTLLPCPALPCRRRLACFRLRHLGPAKSRRLECR